MDQETERRSRSRWSLSTTLRAFLRRPRPAPAADPKVAEVLVALKTEQPALSINALIGAVRERGVELGAHASSSS